MWTWVASVRWRPPLPSRPRSRSRASSSVSSRSVWPSASSRARNSVSTEASKPGSDSSRPSVYFQSSRPRTASAACRSVRPSTNCSTSTSASRAGDHAGRPRAANSSANCSSVNSGPSASRARIARHPLGNAARATRDVSAGICGSPFGRNDIVDLQPSRSSQPIDSKGNDGTQSTTNSPAESVLTLLANSGCWESLGQPGESGGPASGRYGPGEPGVEADEVEGHGGEGVLEEGLGLAAVAGVVDVAAPGGLGDQALDAASECVALAPVAGGLLGPDPLLGLLLAAGQEGHVPGVVLGACAS